MHSEKAAADYSVILDGGNIARWATPADTTAVEDVYGTVFADPSTGGYNDQIVTYLRGLLGGSQPYGSIHDVAIVIDPAGVVVSAVLLMRMPLDAAGTRITAGRPDLVVSRDDVRNRGYIRTLFSLIHARSAAYGDVLQAISGIPYYYRRFGYEYALSLGGSHIYPTDAIPALAAGTEEPYSIRPAGSADIDALIACYRHDCVLPRGDEPLLFTADIDRSYWEFVLSPAAAADTWYPYMIVDRSGATVGSIGVGRFRYSEQLEFYYCNTCVSVDMQVLAPSVLRQLSAIADQVASAAPGTPPFGALRANLGVAHPMHTALAQVLQRREEPYAWSIRVPSPAALLTAIAPVLSARLQAHAVTHFARPLVISLYRGGVSLDYRDGKVSAIDLERCDAPQASYPAGQFVQHVLGFRSTAALTAMHMDVRIDPAARPLLDVLFPAQPSWVTPID